MFFYLFILFSFVYIILCVSIFGWVTLPHVIAWSFLFSFLFCTNKTFLITHFILLKCWRQFTMKIEIKDWIYTINKILYFHTMDQFLWNKNTGRVIVRIKSHRRISYQLRNIFFFFFHHNIYIYWHDDSQVYGSRIGSTVCISA